MHFPHPGGSNYTNYTQTNGVFTKNTDFYFLDSVKFVSVFGRINKFVRHIQGKKEYCFFKKIFFAFSVCFSQRNNNEWSDCHSNISLLKNKSCTFTIYIPNSKIALQGYYLTAGSLSEKFQDSTF